MSKFGATMRLSERDAKRFIAALLGAPKPNAKLREAVKRYRTQMDVQLSTNAPG